MSVTNVITIDTLLTVFWALEYLHDYNLELYDRITTVWLASIVCFEANHKQSQTYITVEARGINRVLSAITI